MARPPRLSGNLPAEVSSFIGRRRELAEIRTQLTQARLVSLIGPGGVGKTRLALRMAADLGRGFPHGVWLVELAEVRDPARICDVALAALDLRDQAPTEPLAQLLAHLRDKKLLLVMDNCEHLLEAAARLVTEIMRYAPGVRVLATSRELLSVPGEQVAPVPPLDLPEADTPLAQLRENEAVRLFTERATAASGGFLLTEANHAAVADLCRRLDGLPLAIELAAVRTRVLSAEQVRDRLTDRFRLLTGPARTAPPRHQTLRTTIDWSHDLLAADEQVLLRRLWVFAGRFTLDDVESVCAPPEQALDLLTSLVDKSLVMRENARGLACYRLHETMREYAGVRLREAGETELIQRRCAEYYRSTCRRSAAEARHRLAEWLGWMDVEIDNVRSVLRRYLTEQDLRHGMDLACSLGWYWMTRATSEGIRWLEELFAKGNDDPRGLFLRGFLAVLQSDPSAARPALERAVAAAQEAGHLRLLSQALSLASMAASMAGDRTESRHLVGRAQAVEAGLDDLGTTLMLLQARALNGLFEGDLAATKAASTAGVRLSRDVEDLYSLGMMLLNLGSAMLIAGELAESEPLLAEGLTIAHLIDDRVAQYCLLDALGCHAASTGDARRAARLLGAAETVRESAGASVLPYLTPLLAGAEESGRGALGAAAFEAEYGVGRGLSRDAAVGVALGEPAAVPAAVAAPLGKRQMEVARLVAEGLSNKEIGMRLFISEHTVDSHVRGILNRLGFNNRAQIAAWAAKWSSQVGASRESSSGSASSQAQA